MTVPTVKYDDEIITDSREILYKICEQHPEKELLPYDEGRRDKVMKYVDELYSHYNSILAFT
jgi:glutathione S-transferase